MRAILNPTIGQVFGIRLNTVTNKNFKGQFSGTDNASAVSLHISQSTGYSDEYGYVHEENKGKLNPVSLAYAWYVSVEDRNREVIVLVGRDLESLYNVLNALALSFAYQGVYGRTLYENVNWEVLNQIRGNNSKGHPIYTMRVYTHALDLEFQVLRNLYNSNFAVITYKQNGMPKCATFSRSPRQVMYAVAKQAVGDCDIMFLNSSILVKKSIQDWVRDEKLPINTPVIGLTKGINTPLSPITEEEHEPYVYSVAAINYGIQKLRERWGGIKNIPLTQTGTVRRIMKGSVCQLEPWAHGEKHGKNEKATGSVWSRNACRINKNMTPEEYARLRQVFAGGSVIMNGYYKNRLVQGVKAFDFSSDYMGIMTHMKFPVSEFVLVKKKAEQKILVRKENISDWNRKCFWYARFEFKNLRMRDGRSIPYWQDSKNVDCTGVLKTDGKVVSAVKFETYMTDVDWYIFSKVYAFDSMNILEMYKADAGLLPEPIIKNILIFYRDKTHHKGTDEVSKYEEAKTLGNSCYGAAVTRLFDDKVIFTEDGWKSLLLDENMFKAIQSEMSPTNTFLPYAIGVWTTAWGRFNLWQFVLEMEDRTLYGDTDSLMGLFNDEDIQHFQAWERWMDERREKICSVYAGIEPYMYRPTRPDGTHTNLGAFELEHIYKNFKYVGLKRYAGEFEEDGKKEIKVAIAGLPKSAAKAHIQKADDMSNSIHWNAIESKLTNPTYNDNQGITRWNGYISQQRYGVAIVPASFTLSSRDDIRNTISLLGRDSWCNMGMPDSSDPIFIKKALDKQ